jgi:transposase-like protein
MGRKSELSAETRVELVLALLRKEEPAAQIARHAGVSEPTLYRWLDEFINGGKAQLRANGSEIAPRPAHAADRFMGSGIHQVARRQVLDGVRVVRRQPEVRAGIETCLLRPAGPASWWMAE